MGLETIVLATGPVVGPQIYSIDQQKAAARDQKRSSQAQQRIQNIKAARERRKQVRQAQQAQAQLSNQAQATGTSSTSSATNAAGSVQTQLAGNLSFLDQVQTLTNRASIFNQKAANHTGRAATGQAVSNLALTAASIFAPKPTP